MSVPRIDELTGPVEVGRPYLVPTVFGLWAGSTRWWPVIGPKHSDAQCLKFDVQHYHFDARFFPYGRADDSLLWRDVFARPLSSVPGLNDAGFGERVWRRRTCRRLANPFVHYVRHLASDSSRWKCHFDQWTGKQARHDGRGWVCPHRSVALTDHAAVDGVITCPLHLLRIDAASGRVLPPLRPDANEVAG